LKKISSNQTILLVAARVRHEILMLTIQDSISLKTLQLCRIEQRFSQKGVEQLGPEPTGNCKIFEENIKQSDYLSSVVLMNYGLTRLSTEQPYELLSLASWADLGMPG
jgi:hypothetical protein